MWEEATHKYTFSIRSRYHSETFTYNVKALAYVTDPDAMYIQFQDGSCKWVSASSLQKINKYEETK